MYQILLVSFLVVAVALVGLILVQHGKGADMGASFGAGASNTVFGASGSGNFLTRTTAILALLFFSLALGLGYLTAHKSSPTGVDLATQIEKEQAAKKEASKEIEVPAAEIGIPNVKVDDVTTESASAVPDVKVEAEKKATEVKSEAGKKVEELKKKAQEKDKPVPVKDGSGH